MNVGKWFSFFAVVLLLTGGCHGVAFATTSTIVLPLEGRNVPSNAMLPISMTVRFDSVQTTAMLSFSVDVVNHTTVPVEWKSVAYGLTIAIYSAADYRALIPLPTFDDRPWRFWGMNSTIPEGLLWPGTTGTIHLRCVRVPNESVFGVSALRPIQVGRYRVNVLWLNRGVTNPSISLGADSECKETSHTFSSEPVQTTGCLVIVPPE
jgi:hypothetical protein